MSNYPTTLNIDCPPVKINGHTRLIPCLDVDDNPQLLIITNSSLRPGIAPISISGASYGISKP